MEITRSVEPADRQVCEEGIGLAYEIAGLPRPQRIEWCLGPVEIERSRACNWHRYDPGASVKKRLIDVVLASASQDIERNVPASIRFPVTFAIGFPPHFTAPHAAITEAIVAAARQVRPVVSAEIRNFARWIAGLRRVPYADFALCAWSQHDSRNWLAVCECLRDVCGFEKETAAVKGLLLMGANAGWVVPHERVCWVSERHQTLQVDVRGRLHSAVGPALCYPDGWCHYSWKGVPVPGWLIEHPDRITPARIDAEPNTFVRLCMIDILTPERYVFSGAPVRAATDRSGTLWRKEWWAGDGWAAVEVVNGTPDPDGSHRHYFLQVPPELRTPAEAVAWTYGLSAEAYSHLAVRT